MSHRHYIIEDGKVRPATFAEWGAFFECCERHVGDTKVGNARISTVFLGLDHSWTGGVPILFETMVFDFPEGLHEGFWSNSMWRYATMAQAEAGHKLAVERVREFLTDAEVTETPCHPGALREGMAERFAQIEKQLSGLDIFPEPSGEEWKTDDGDDGN